MISKLKLFSWAFVLFILLSACQSIEYASDAMFFNSAQANSFEYLVRVNGKPCKDMDGRVGLCAKRLSTKENLVFTQDARPYSYQVFIQCSKGLVDQTFSVGKNKPFSMTIYADQIKEKSFTCIGEVIPNDRAEVSALWSVRVMVYDGDYIPRETIYIQAAKGKEALILGRYARFTNIGDQVADKKTAVKYDKNKTYYSESEAMRFNYYNF